MDKFVVRMTNVCAGPFPESHMDFEASSGEITAIGSNGEGKTTLAKVLAGMLPRISGDIWLDDRKLDIHSISSAHRNGIYLMTESLQLFPGKSIMDNLLLGIEQLIFHNRLFNPSKEKKEAVCRQVLKELGLDLNLEQSVDHLSQGEQCLLQIGRILLCRPRILIMDEFSASLTVLETKRIMNLLTGLKQKNICIILISHEYSTVIRYCDCISLVEQGRITESYSRAELGDEAFVRRVLTFKKSFSYPKLARTPGQPLLTARHLSSGIIKDVSFTLQEGEILGIAGVSGNGQKELMEALAGLRPTVSGYLEVRGEDISRSSPRERISRGIWASPSFCTSISRRSPKPGRNSIDFTVADLPVPPSPKRSTLFTRCPSSMAWVLATTCPRCSS